MQITPEQIIRFPVDKLPTKLAWFAWQTEARETELGRQVEDVLPLDLAVDMVRVDPVPGELLNVVLVHHDLLHDLGWDPLLDAGPIEACSQGFAPKPEHRASPKARGHTSQAPGTEQPEAISLHQ